MAKRAMRKAPAQKPTMPARLFYSPIYVHRTDKEMNPTAHVGHPNPALVTLFMRYFRRKEHNFVGVYDLREIRVMDRAGRTKQIIKPRKVRPSR